MAAGGAQGAARLPGLRRGVRARRGRHPGPRGPCLPAHGRRAGPRGLQGLRVAAGARHAARARRLGCACRARLEHPAALLCVGNALPGTERAAPLRAQTADQAIAQLFSQIGQEIESVYRVITGQSKPQFTINPPQLFNNGATNVSTTLVRARTARRRLKRTLQEAGRTVAHWAAAGVVVSLQHPVGPCSAALCPLVWQLCCACWLGRGGARRAHGGPTPLTHRRALTVARVRQAGAQGLAVGINYNPCVISVSTRGADVTAAGINVQPNVRPRGHLRARTCPRASGRRLPGARALSLRRLRLCPVHALVSHAPSQRQHSHQPVCGAQVIEVLAEGAAGAPCPPHLSPALCNELR